MNIFTRIKNNINAKRKHPPKYIVYVEDGSVDIDALEYELDWRYKGDALLITYRTGGIPPTFIDVKHNRRIK